MAASGQTDIATSRFMPIGVALAAAHPRGVAGQEFGPDLLLVRRAGGFAARGKAISGRKKEFGRDVSILLSRPPLAGEGSVACRMSVASRRMCDGDATGP